MSQSLTARFDFDLEQILVEVVDGSVTLRIRNSEDGEWGPSMAAATHIRPDDDRVTRRGRCRAR